MLVDLDEARVFLGEHHRGVLATHRTDSGIQQSPVLVNVDGEGRAIISSRETAYKVRNLRRDPRAQVCVFTDGFFGQWLFVEGRADVLSLPDALDPLIDYYTRFPDELNRRKRCGRDRAQRFPRSSFRRHAEPGCGKASAEPNRPAPPASPRVWGRREPGHPLAPSRGASRPLSADKPARFWREQQGEQCDVEERPPPLASGQNRDGSRAVSQDNQDPGSSAPTKQKDCNRRQDDEREDVNLDRRASAIQQRAEGKPCEPRDSEDPQRTRAFSETSHGEPSTRFPQP